MHLRRICITQTYYAILSVVASPLTLRLNPETRRRLDRIARRKGSTTSQVLREAIEDLVRREDCPGSAWERMKHLVGVVEGGDPALSENTGKRFAEQLRVRRKAR